MLNDSINSLNPEQKKAVLTTEGPLLILAGAGSGKTRVLTHRIAYLIEQGVRPYNILAITFTNKAAREMKERVCAITPEGDDVWVSTFHSSCVRILRREADKMGYDSRFSIYDADDSERLIREILKGMNISDKVLKPSSVLAEISAQKDKLIGPEKYAKLTEKDFRLKKISDIYTAYQKHLKSNNAMDFDDLIYVCTELFRTRPDVLEKWQDRFRYILVDEYQDTNASQYRLVSMLAQKYGNLCVVGDDDQSIYGWRGADIRNILDFEKDFKDTVVIRLEQNYRSGANILNAANAVIKNNVMRKTKTLRTAAGAGNMLHFYRARSDIEESAFIAEKIAEGVSHGGRYSDYAILYRNNSLSRVLEEGLIRAGIPYRLFGGVRFYGRREIMDILSYLKAICNPGDDMPIRRIINVPKRGIGDTTVAKLAEAAEENGISFYTALLSADAVPSLKGKTKQLEKFAELLVDLRDKAESESVSELIEDILDDTGYRSELEKENTDEARGRLENLQELVNKAVEYEQDNENADLAGFLEEVALVADVDAYTDNADTAVLMTLHSSKGLEFPTVFIAAFEEGIFPGFRAITSGKASDMEEERRLCYVGITRAKVELFFTSARERMQYGSRVANLPSRFLEEIPPDIVEHMSDDRAAAENRRSFAYGANRVRPKPVNSYRMPEPKQAVTDFGPGDKVRHIKFGIGTVIAMEEKRDGSFEITVDFDNMGRRTVNSAFANLKKV